VTIVPDDPLPRRRRPWWVLVVAAVLVVVLGAALWPLGTGRPAPPAATLPPTTVASAAPSAQIVVYVVTAGTGDIGSVQYTDQDGDMVSRDGVKLPWRFTFHVNGPRHGFVLIAQRKQGGSGSVSCSITVDGKELSTATHTGRYAAPMCSAS
jgi:hypothetical protein